jgi:hypothetical protein
MDQCAGNPDVWSQILNGLMGGVGCRSEDGDRMLNEIGTSRVSRRKASSVALTGDAEYGCIGQSANIRIIDRTEQSATVAWHDPTSCHYDDQRWHRARATRDGVCAISGTIIQRGADIYRPSRARPVPVNAGAMILASMLLPLTKADVCPGTEYASI